MAFAPIAQEVQAIVKKLGLSSDLSVIEHAWNLEVGPLKDVARISALDNASLVIEADSHAVVQEISLRRKELIRKLNNHLPNPFLQFITVRIAQRYGR